MFQVPGSSPTLVQLR